MYGLLGLFKGEYGKWVGDAVGAFDGRRVVIAAYGWASMP